MHSDLLERCQTARAEINIPAFPRASIQAAAQRTPQASSRKRPIIAAAIAGFSVIAIAAAAEMAVQTHIHFTQSGGMVLSSNAKNDENRDIHSEAEVAEAAKQLNFAVTLPAGLPAGTQPIRLFRSGHDVLVVTYNLPGQWRASHHLLWIFIANPAAVAQAPSAPRLHLQRRYADPHMSSARWRAGAEEVIVVSNGLTPSELQSIKAAMR